MDKMHRIALIAGSGKFPILLARAAKDNGIEVIVIAINSAAEKSIEKIADKIYWVNIGQAKKLIDILLKEEIRYAIMAGKVNKAIIIKQALTLDKEARGLLKRIADKRDDTILLSVANRLKDFGVELIDSTFFLKDLMPGKGVLTKRRPNRQELEDIKFGFSIAKDMGALDIGQSVIVKQKAVIAVEAIEGTDSAIRRAGILAGKGTVVVKVSKPKQDMRFDVPVVGIETLKALKDAGSSVLAIEAGKVLVLEKEPLVTRAEKAGLSIVAV